MKGLLIAAAVLLGAAPAMSHDVDSQRCYVDVSVLARKLSAYVNTQHQHKVRGVWTFAEGGNNYVNLQGNGELEVQCEPMG